MSEMNFDKCVTCGEDITNITYKKGENVITDGCILLPFCRDCIRDFLNEER